MERFAVSMRFAKKLISPLARLTLCDALSVSSTMLA
jgi:hypothetical protein